MIEMIAEDGVTWISALLTGILLYIYLRRYELVHGWSHANAFNNFTAERCNVTAC